MNVKWSKLRACSKSDQFSILLDLLMLWLIVINLTLIVFDTLFATQSVQHWLGEWVPTFTDFYRDVVHVDFLLLDLVFVSLFLIEFFGRWLSAVIRHTYGRWFFYPLIHWYDLLGCIPMALFRWLRLFRVIDIGRKLQMLEVIDVRNSRIFRVVFKVRDIVVEEISDRVVSNILCGVQHELQHDSPVTHKINEQVIKPRQDLLVDWLTSRLNQVATSLYHPRRTGIQNYVKEIVTKALRTEGTSEHLKWVPLLGGPMRNAVEDTIGDVVFLVIDRAFHDISSSGRYYLLREVCDLVVNEMLKPHPDLSSEARGMMIDVIELVKEQVAVKRWQEAFLKPPSGAKSQ